MCRRSRLQIFGRGIFLAFAKLRPLTQSSRLSIPLASSGRKHGDDWYVYRSYGYFPGDQVAMLALRYPLASSGQNHGEGITPEPSGSFQADGIASYMHNLDSPYGSEEPGGQAACLITAKEKAFTRVATRRSLGSEALYVWTQVDDLHTGIYPGKSTVGATPTAGNSF